MANAIAWQHGETSSIFNGGLGWSGTYLDLGVCVCVCNTGGGGMYMFGALTCISGVLNAI